MSQLDDDLLVLKLRKKVANQRRALRQLTRAHAVLWKVIRYRNEFHDYAVKEGSFVRFRNATEDKTA